MWCASPSTCFPLCKAKPKGFHLRLQGADDLRKTPSAAGVTLDGAHAALGLGSAAGKSGLPRSWRSWPVMPNEHAAYRRSIGCVRWASASRRSPSSAAAAPRGVRRLEASRRAGPGLARAGGAQ